MRDRIGKSRLGAKIRTKSHKRYRRDLENGKHLGGRRRTRRHEGVSSVDVDPGYLENIKEAESGSAKLSRLKLQLYRDCIPFVASAQRF